jgi:hypothetical protein
VREPQTTERATRTSDALAEVTPDHRRRTTRQARHTARTTLHVLSGNDEALEDADLLCPQVAHDLGRKTSPKPKGAAKPGRRPGFKVWKTTFWKRRRTLWAAQNAAARRLANDG